MICFTEAAAKVILDIMNEQNVNRETFCRVGVKGGGCSGFTYTVDFDSRKTKFDLEFESHGLTCVVDKKSHLLLNGLTIDWSNDLSAPGPRFENPKATSTCGCSTSFNVKNDAISNKPSWMP